MQTERLKAYMATHGGITQKEATDKLGISRLPAQIFRLRERGETITAIWETGRNRFGEKIRYKRYFLGRDGEFNGESTGNVILYG